MKMEFTENYPEEVPIISVRGMKQLTRAQVDPLHHLLKEKGEELLGQQMVYELATYLQEWMANGAEDPNKKEGGFEGQKMVIENNVKHGTPVSRENFASWLEGMFLFHPFFTLFFGHNLQRFITQSIHLARCTFIYTPHHSLRS